MKIGRVMKDICIQVVHHFIKCIYMKKIAEAVEKLRRLMQVLRSCRLSVYTCKEWTSVSQVSVSVKASLTFKCMTEHLFADFSCSIALDTYLWKQMMQMNRKLIYIWYNVDKKHLLFTKRKCHKFSWLFTASRCSPRKRSICACRIACKVLVSIGLYSLSFGFLKKGFLLGKQCL